eukprot:6475587-Amphidinium_carterae.1
MLSAHTLKSLSLPQASSVHILGPQCVRVMVAKCAGNAVCALLSCSIEGAWLTVASTVQSTANRSQSLCAVVPRNKSQEALGLLPLQAIKMLRATTSYFQPRHLENTSKKGIYQHSKELQHDMNQTSDGVSVL